MSIKYEEYVVYILIDLKAEPEPEPKFTSVPEQEPEHLFIYLNGPKI